MAMLLQVRWMENQMLACECPRSLCGAALCSTTWKFSQRMPPPLHLTCTLPGQALPIAITMRQLI